MMMAYYTEKSSLKVDIKAVKMLDSDSRIYYHFSQRRLSFSLPQPQYEKI